MAAPAKSPPPPAAAAAAPPTTPPAPPTKTAAVARMPKKEEWQQPGGKEKLDALSPFVVQTINKALPKFLAGSGDRLVRCAVTACQSSDALMKCTPISIFSGVIAAAQLGLEIGGPRGEAYLIPYKGKAQLQIGYKGFLQLGHRSEKLAVCAPVDVRANDTFRVYGGTNRRIVHDPFQGPHSKAGKVVAYYCIIKLVNGGEDFEYFYVEDAITFRDNFSAGREYRSGPWYKPGWAEPDGDPTQEFNEMAKKTLIRKLFKRLPISAEAQAAAGYDEMAEIGISQRLPETFFPEIDAEPSGVERVEQALAGRTTSPPTASPPTAPPPPPTTITKETAGQSAIAKLLTQIDAEQPDDEGKWTGEWLRRVGYEGLDQIEVLSEAKQSKLAEELRAKVVELGAEPVA